MLCKYCGKEIDDGFVFCPHCQNLLITSPSGASKEDLANGVSDEQGVVYSQDGKRLLECKNQEITEYTVKEGTEVVCDWAFYKCEKLKVLTIAESVTLVGNGIFSYCNELEQLNFNAISCTTFGILVNLERWGNFFSPKLTKIIIGDKVNTIPDYLFHESSPITDLTIGKSVKTIGGNAFHYCPRLVKINIPDSVTEIGEDAFSSCLGLKEVTIGNGVTTLGINAFSYCTALEEVTMGNSVTTIGENAFYECNVLTKVNIPDSVTEIGETAFFSCTKLSEVTIPDKVTMIGAGAFLGCESFPELYIPASVESIGNRAFGCCYALKHIEVSDENKHFCSVDGVLYSKDMSKLIQFPPASSVKSFVVPNSVKEIGNFAFVGAKNLTSITLPDGLIKIGMGAFCECSKLPSITLPESVTEISEFAFSRCKGLTSLVIPQGVSKMDYNVCSRCTSLTSITIPKSVTEIGNIAFGGCKNLANIILLNPEPPKCVAPVEISFPSAKPLIVFDDGFSGVNTNTCVVRVPKGSKKAYASAYGWKEFKNIEEIE